MSLDLFRCVLLHCQPLNVLLHTAFSVEETSANCLDLLNLRLQ